MPYGHEFIPVASQRDSYPGHREVGSANHSDIRTLPTDAQPLLAMSVVDVKYVEHDIYENIVHQELCGIIFLYQLQKD